MKWNNPSQTGFRRICSPRNETFSCSNPHLALAIDDENLMKNWTCCAKINTNGRNSLWERLSCIHRRQSTSIRCAEATNVNHRNLFGIGMFQWKVSSLAVVCILIESLNESRFSYPSHWKSHWISLLLFYSFRTFSCCQSSHIHQCWSIKEREKKFKFQIQRQTNQKIK